MNFGPVSALVAPCFSNLKFWVVVNIILVPGDRFCPPFIWWKNSKVRFSGNARLLGFCEKIFGIERYGWRNLKLPKSREERNKSSDINSRD